MNKLSFLAVRLLAVYLIIIGTSGIIGLPTFIKMIGEESNDPYLFIQIFSVIIPFAIGIILWLYTAFFSNIIYSKNQEENVNINDTQIISAGTFVIGVYLLVSALPGLYVAVSQYISLPELYDSQQQLQPVLSWVIQVVSGIFLIVGQRYMVSLYLAFRRFGA